MDTDSIVTIYETNILVEDLEQLQEKYDIIDFINLENKAELYDEINRKNSWCFKKRRQIQLTLMNSLH